MKLAGQGTTAIRAPSTTLGAGQHGYAMAGLLVGLAVMAVLMGMALPVWSHHTKREKEEELIWRGQQYARAVGLFQRKYANTYPPTVDVLVEQKFLRKKYKDPVTNDDFQLIPAGGGPQMPGQMSGPPGARGQTQQQPQMQPQPQAGFPAQGRGQQSGPLPGGGQTTTAPGSLSGVNLGVAGVMSKSKATSIKIYNGRQKHNEWAFVYIQTAQAISPAGGAMPGMPARGGRGPAGPGINPMAPGGRGFNPPGPGGFGPGSPQRPPVPGQFGQPPFGQPPFGQPPFGQPGQPGQPQPGSQQRPRPPGG